MLQFAMGACLAGAIAAHALGSTGHGWLIRHLHKSRHRRAVIATTAIGVFLANLLCLIAPTSFVTSDLVVALTLVFLASLVLSLYRSTKLRDNSPEVRRTVVAVGAHPDDLELACGGTLAKLVDSGFEVHALVMSHGQVRGDSPRHPSEALAGGNYLGLADLAVLDLPDTHLSQNNMEMVEAIEAKIRATSPQLVFTHSAHDHHQDHHAVHLATLRAARRHSSILCFESPSSTRAFNPSVYVDIEAYVDVKVQAVLLHRNQAGKPYVSADRVRGTASFRGSQAKREFAEGFEPVRLLANTLGVLP